MNSICDNCALKLYNTKVYNLSGVGNPFMGKCIVVPNVDYSAYKGRNMTFSAQVDIIRQSILLPTGDLESNFYIVPLIRCNEQISCEVDVATFNKCKTIFANDVRKYDFKDILLLGSAARRFLNCKVTDYLNTCFISKNNRRYYVNYSPLVQYVDNKLFDIFKTNLIKWYNCVTNNIFDYKVKLI